LSSSALARASMGGLLPLEAAALAVAGTSGVDAAALGVVVDDGGETGAVSSVSFGHPATARTVNIAIALVEKLTFTCRLLLEKGIPESRGRCTRSGNKASHEQDARFFTIWS